MIQLLYTTKEWEQKMNVNNMNVVICAFCEQKIADEIDYTYTQSCVDCNEYKGITTVGDYFAGYGILVSV